MNFKKFEKFNIEQAEQRKSSFASSSAEAMADKSAEAMEDKKEGKELSLEKIPDEVKNILQKLEEQGYEAYMVGGCVRSFFKKNVEPNDWDMTTNAKPEEIQKIFPHNFYENKFGTVTVVNETSNASLKHIEITPFRGEEKYTDKRHPDKVEFVGTLEQDLKRRDLTVNAMAARIKDEKIEIIDPFNGQEDLRNKVIRAVGSPEERFQEDALRMIRAPRFATCFGFSIEKETKKAIQENAELLSVIAKERIRDEFFKIIESKNPSEGIEMLKELNIFSKVFPEIEKEFVGKNFKKENFPLLEKSADTDSSLESRLALFFLDLKNIKDIDEIELSEKSLKYLRIPNRNIKKTSALFCGNKMVKNFEKLDKQTARRLWITFASKNRIDDDVKKTMEDFIFIQKIQGEDKYTQQDVEDKKKMIFEASEDPLFLNDLKLKGEGIIEGAKVRPNSKVSKISKILLEKVIKNPEINNRKDLISEAKELNALQEKELNFRLLETLPKQ